MTTAIREDKRMKFSLSLAIVLVAVIGATAQRGPTIIFPAQGSTTIPFKISDNLVFVSATVNGTAGNFIFDTGAGSTVVDEAFAKKVGLVRSGHTTGNGAAGTSTAGVLHGASVKLGGITIGKLTVYSLPLEP